MTQSFKKIGFVVLFTALTVASVQAQTSPNMKSNKHHCTDACANGKHMYQHGEKKHKCSASCKPMSSATMELKDHVCSSACHESGKCVMAHGEKGHICGASCKTSK